MSMKTKFKELGNYEAAVISTLDGFILENHDEDTSENVRKNEVKREISIIT